MARLASSPTSSSKSRSTPMRRLKPSRSRSRSAQRTQRSWGEGVKFQYRGEGGRARLKTVNSVFLYDSYLNGSTFECVNTTHRPVTTMQDPRPHRTALLLRHVVFSSLAVLTVAPRRNMP